ncbi:rhomboid family intramembrane serine protease [Saccharopolyspora flava]|nr:rhomboid family intramembrane serine protease [Saccharopolyspora flava]
MTRPMERPRPRVLPANPLKAAFGMLVCVAVLFGIELYDVATPAPNIAMDLDGNGIRPRTLDGLDGILWAPLLHFGWQHLISNSVPLFVLGWLLLAGGLRQFIGVTAVVWIVAGAGTWLIGAPGYHVGASGVIFGWMVFLLLRGFAQRSIAQILVSVVLFFYWGGMLWGVLPGQPGISWEGHLFGAIGGVLATWLVARSTRRRVSRTEPGTLAG